MIPTVTAGTGRPVLLMCEAFLWDVDPEMPELCNLQWSTWNDMEPTFPSMLNAVDQNDRWWPLTRPGFFSCPFIMLFSEYLHRFLLIASPFQSTD